MQKNPPKNCLFGATSIVKNNDKEKYVYSCYGIAFDGKGKQSFGNDPSSENIFQYFNKVQFLVSMEGLVHQEKKFAL